MKSKMIKVSEETHSQFKAMAKEKGMLLDPFLMLLVKEYKKQLARGE